MAIGVALVSQPVSWEFLSFVYPALSQCAAFWPAQRTTSYEMLYCARTKISSDVSSPVERRFARWSLDGALRVLARGTRLHGCLDVCLAECGNGMSGLESAYNSHQLKRKMR